MSPEAQAALREAAEVSAEADVALTASFGRRVPEVDPMAGWEPTRPPEPEPVRRSMAAPEQRRAPAAAAKPKDAATVAAERALGRWRRGFVERQGAFVGVNFLSTVLSALAGRIRALNDDRARESRELAVLVHQLAKRVDELEKGNRP